MDISTKEGRAEWRRLMSHRAMTQREVDEALQAFGAALRLLDERDLALETQQAVAEYLSNEMMHLKAEHARIIRERDAEVERMEKLLDHWKATSMNDTARAEKLAAERDEAERLHNAKCGEHHQALVARDRAQAALRLYANSLNWNRDCRFDPNGSKFNGISTAAAALSPEPPPAPSPEITDEMVERAVRAHDASIGCYTAMRAALTAALGKKP